MINYNNQNNMRYSKGSNDYTLIINNSWFVEENSGTKYNTENINTNNITHGMKKNDNVSFQNQK